MYPLRGFKAHFQKIVSPFRFMFTSMNRTLSLLLFLFSLCVSTPNLAQEYTQEIKTYTGDTFRGSILEVREDSTIILSRSLGKISLESELIKSVRTINLKRLTKDSLWSLNASQTNHFVGATAYNLEKGESYYQNSWLFFNQFVYGITDHFSIGGGFFPGVLIGLNALPFWITPKVSIPITKDKLNASVGGMIAHDMTQDQTTAIPYGNVSLGETDKNITLGVAWVNNTYAESMPAISLSTLIRTSNKGYFISENYYMNRQILICIGGRRMLGRAALDFGVALSAWESETYFALPWLGFRLPLSKEKLE